MGRTTTTERILAITSRMREEQEAKEKLAPK